MGDVYRLPEIRRELIADGDHSELRATWHTESGLVVISLWKGDTCVASSHLNPTDAARLGIFITNGLADLATHVPPRIQSLRRDAESGSPLSTQVEAVIRQWRESTAWLLNAAARRIGR